MLSMNYQNEARSAKQEAETANLPHISVCVCTFKRPLLLRRLLKELCDQDTGGLFTFSIVVVDNDHAESAKSIVENSMATSLIRAAYCVEPRQNIALARNKAIENASGDFIAFIDDDEFPVKDWLRNLFETCRRYGTSGVLGPVRPHFAQTPPAWMTEGKFAERPTYQTGYALHWRQSRTGNVLFKKEIVRGADPAFRVQFGTGGEDVDFFERMMKKGCAFVWCNEADVFEEVPPDRCTRRYHLRRALLRGKNSFEREGIKAGSVAKSLLAMSVYGCAFPLLLVMGQYRLMKYAIKFSDHAGKILALLGVNPVSER
jgi:succinoglycan biosynthesis protein ExoM